ncbi:MAG: HlyC/CorC family transporter [Chloroflexi bacterium]|nr:HlyC/CorC family transporter [Chloroflexota bacterium]MBK6711577.1 HlyC/CorC family transporter [Chloroflexota bacterium]MBK7177209.1 HlyC/CorC family transporter [Chloroflexota bacterium]MBK8931402.1 HlyC/CorC family transporter [Chloroflexota bacterium]MBP6804474.1 HlyC/CorC family transporter [Chloroflexota bacterium]
MLILLILIFINGIFAMSEIAVVSARKARLQQRANDGSKRAEAALALANKPNDFLSTVQIGITLIGILMGAFGSTGIAASLDPYLQNLPLSRDFHQQLSNFLAIGVVTYLSLVLGELVPKQIGLGNAEKVAGITAAPMLLLAAVTRPFVWTLSISTRAVMRLLPINPSNEPAITEAEIQMMLEQGTESGVVEPIEEEIVEKLFRVGDLRVNDLMIDRTDIIWLDLEDSTDALREKIADGVHSRYPVANGDLDNIVGLVFVKDLLVQALSSETPELKIALKPALFVPSGLPVYNVLERFKEAKAQIAFVTDEHGGIEGLVTFNDLLEAIVGDVPEQGDPADPIAIRRADGSWLIDGKLSIEEFKLLFEVAELPEESENYFQTVGGFVMSYLGRIPQSGDQFSWGGLTIEVMDMDWRRVDKVLVKQEGG